jgi:hypothetical protein
VVIAGLVVTVVGCMGYVPGRQSYWDAKVKEMCEKDGGVTIYEKVHISKSEIDRGVLPMTADGKLGVAFQELASPDAPVYAVNKTKILREGSPGVWRSEWDVIRRADKSTVARVVVYERIGGDFPSPAHDSRIACPDLKDITRDLDQLFIVEGGAK